MSKSIKKIYKILVIFLLVIFVLLATSFFTLQNSAVQTYITQKIAEKVSENLDAKFTVESVNYRFFNRVVLNNVYIEDQLNDTLLFSKEIICSLRKIDHKKRQLEISKVNLVNAKIYLHKYDTLQPMNLKFAKNRTIDKDSLSTENKWEVTLKNIELHQSVFRYKSVRKTEKPKDVVNFNDLVCFIEELEVRNLSIENGVVNFYTKKLKVREISGFKAYNVKFNMSIGKQHMIFRNVKIRTPYSYINSDSLVFRHNDYDEYQEFAKNIYLDFAFQESNISFKDIGFFVPIFKNIDINSVISGRVYSKLSSFKGDDVTFQIGEQTELITDFNLSGLPDYNQMFMYVDFKKLTTSAKDFEVINEFSKKGEDFTISENFNNLGIISYKGNFAGFYDDFVTYGKFTSDLGNISTDLSLRPDTSKTLAFSGNIKTSQFDIGKLFNNNNRVGEISMNAQINGFTSSKKVNATTVGTIQNIVINDYNYQNISLDGKLTEKTYNGYLSISDPNIQFDFTGNIDFSKDVPEFDFKASVPYSNLYGLNIDKKDTTANLAFDLTANFKGIDIDHAVGEINFTNTQLTKFNTEMSFDTLKIISEMETDTHRIELKSDYVDALLIGKYQSKNLFQSVKNMYYHYLPSLVNEPTDTLTLEANNSFTFDVHLKNTNLISRFFIPNVYVSDSTKLQLVYNANQRFLFFRAFTNKLQYNKHTFEKLSIQSFSDDSIFTIRTKSQSLLFNNYFKFDDFKTTTLTKKNTIDLKVDWNNNDTVTYQGKILASTTITQKKDFADPSFKITLLPSQIIVRDSIWFIDKSQVNIDTTSIKFTNFKINHGKQFFIVNGKVSENAKDTLFFDFQNINLAHLNAITAEKKLLFDGIINGKANFSSIFNNPLFYSDLEIDNLKLNNEDFGYTRIFTRWLEHSKSIQLEASTLHNNKRTINISGNYFPESKNIMFNIILNKLELSVLNPYLNSFASDVSGVGDGSILVTGTLKKPQFNGTLYMQNAAMTIDYIKTRYQFTTDVLVKNNTLNFKQVEAFDTFENRGITNGYVKFGPQKDISFDFNINASKMLALNTTSYDNEDFFGTAFMSGIINITGDRDKTDLDISAKTENNTKINIPLTNNDNSYQSGFVTFTDAKKESPENEKPYYNDYSDFRLNFDLQITPDAEAQLIFDSKIGDIIRGNGEGNIKMVVDEDNDFKMYGDFTIEEGDYLFTLQNVINKKFKIENGGNIVWNGAPYNANIDIAAVYSLKTSLSSLIDTTQSASYYSNDDYKRRIPVDCKVFLTNNLMNPDIRFDINLPTADEEAKTLVRSATDTEEKLNKQFLSLLVLNSFMREQTGTAGGFTENSSTSGLGSVTTSELLSNQLSHWLSQISDEWDIGVNYRPGDEISKDQVEVALSTQVLDDRVTINGNVGYGGQTVEQASNIVGDFNVDVKLNKSGKLRLKAFNESNDKLLYEDAPYTQGVGIFYREEFNSFSELLNNFWNKISKRNKDNNNQK